jgi:hypothetical protein
MIVPVAVKTIQFYTNLYEIGSTGCHSDCLVSGLRRAVCLLRSQ